MHPRSANTSLAALAALAALPAVTLLVAAGCSSSPGGAVATTSSADIGPGGGTLASADGALTLTIPAGALGTTQTITITEIPPAQADPALVAAGPDRVWRMEPDGLVFAIPAQVDLDLPPPAVVASGTLDAVVPELLMASGGSVEGPASFLVEITADDVRLSAPVEHFSDFGQVEDSQNGAKVKVVWSPAVIPTPGQAQVNLSFTPPSTAFPSSFGWSVTSAGLTEDFDQGYDSSQWGTDYLIQCDGSTTTPWGEVEATWSAPSDPFHPSGQSGTVQVRFEPGCGPPGPGITQDTLHTFPGQTDFESVNRTDGTCYPQDSLILSTGTGALVFDPYASPGTSPFATYNNGSPTIDSFAIGGPSSSAYQTFAQSTAFVTPLNPATCVDDFGGAFLTDLAVDGNYFSASGSVGTISASNQNSLVVTKHSAWGTVEVVPHATSGAPASAVANTDATAAVWLNETAQGLVHSDLTGPVPVETPIWPTGPNSKSIVWDPFNELGAWSDFDDDTVSVFRWNGQDPPVVVGTVAVGDGPGGIDVWQDRIVSAGFGDDTRTLIEVDTTNWIIESVDTQPLPFISPPPAPDGTPLTPGHAFFLRDANNTLGFSLKGIDAVGLTPFQF